MPQSKPSKSGKSPTKSEVTNAAGRQVHNKMLLALSGENCATFFSKLDYVELPVETVLAEVGERIKHAYFMNSGLASVLTIMAGNKSVEVGLCGSEGYVGVPLSAGFLSSPARVFIQVAGSAFRVSTHDFQTALHDCPMLAQASQRFAQEIALQSAQVAACNRLHGIDQRLARWLLMSQDRLGGNIVALTQEFLSHMLGSRRASVTVAAGILQRAGIISYVRGVVKIVSREKLEEASCECYELMVRQISKWHAELK